MLFSEVYGSYYNVIAAILSEAVSGELTEKRINDIIREKAFGESVLTIPVSLRNGSWPLLTRENTTPLKHIPSMPLTILQKRWLKALLQDPRIRLFSASESGLEDIEPLYGKDVFCFFDRYSDGDPYDDPQYIAHFKTILTAFHEKRKLRIRFIGHRGTLHSWECIPYKLEYSSKDDKFRVLTSSPRSMLTVNIARIKSCELLDFWTDEEYRPKTPVQKTLVLELKDERNALERVMLHFSHLEKETVRLGNGLYRLTLRYDREDETEMLIRVLSFGPVVQVVSPGSFIDKVKERLHKQFGLRA
ncbi:WYL domain-containing protein [Yanshouia hominis]|uniref:WYL domain-containing protein n=1 Tax=Yanshouia hominis TaxID=2763673 RepID=A0ABR7NIX7_9FIRM|nr:WYL domain-containing protein [Yanshouia hominis]MBC8576330.1 WYL domain-containing protein [Yanshouia hominis]